LGAEFRRGREGEGREGVGTPGDQISLPDNGPAVSQVPISAKHPGKVVEAAPKVGALCNIRRRLATDLHM